MEESYPPPEQWQCPKPNCTSPGLPRLGDSYWMLVVHYYCSYSGAFSLVFLCGELPLCTLLPLCAAFGRAGG